MSTIQRIELVQYFENTLDIATNIINAILFVHKLHNGTIESIKYDTPRYMEYMQKIFHMLDNELLHTFTNVKYVPFEYRYDFYIYIREKLKSTPDEYKHQVRALQTYFEHILVQSQPLMYIHIYLDVI